MTTVDGEVDLGLGRVRAQVAGQAKASHLEETRRSGALTF